MNYIYHYNCLMERAKNRTLIGYSERHHIQPKCLGGTNDKINIVRLTPEEHYTAHLLLVKIHPDNHKLIWAASAMNNKTQTMPRKNKRYGWLRRKFAEAARKTRTGKKMSLEARQKISKARKDKKCSPHTAETKAKMSIASKGKLKSVEHRQAMSISKLGKKRSPHTAETKAKMSIAARHRKHTAETKAKISAARCKRIKEINDANIQEI